MSYPGKHYMKREEEKFLNFLMLKTDMTLALSVKLYVKNHPVLKD
jgi:hypothetical protein